MATFTICLGNPRALTFRWQELVDEIIKLFLPVIKQNKSFGKVRVFSTKAKPAGLLPHDVLIYVWGGHGDRPVHGRFATAPLGNDQYGYTGWDVGGNNLTGAELYIRGRSPKFLARMAFHEVLHFKTHWADSTLHKHKSRGLAQGAINAETPLTDGNIRLMSKFLGKQRNFYTQPFKTYKPFQPISLDGPL